MNDYSDHVPIFIRYRIENANKIIDDTKIMVKNRKKMQWKSRELLYDLYMPDSIQETLEAFEKCNKNKTEWKKVKPFDVEKTYKEIDKEVKGAWKREIVREAFNNMFNEFFTKKVRQENHILQPKESHRNLKIATNYTNKRTLLNIQIGPVAKMDDYEQAKEGQIRWDEIQLLRDKKDISRENKE